MSIYAGASYLPYLFSAVESHAIDIKRLVLLASLRRIPREGRRQSTQCEKHKTSHCTLAFRAGSSGEAHILHLILVVDMEDNAPTEAPHVSSKIRRRLITGLGVGRELEKQDMDVNLEPRS